MTTMYPCERVDLTFIRDAKFRFSNSVDLAITPEQLFEVLSDADSWPQWAKVITGSPDQPQAVRHRHHPHGEHARRIGG